MKKTILLIIYLLCNSVFTYSQWIQTEGPYGEISGSAIFENNSKFYVGTNCGLFEQERISGRWKYFAGIDVKVYAQKGDSIFYSDSNSGSGIDFINLKNDNPTPISFGRMTKVNAIKATKNFLFAGLDFNGFAKSDGFSDSWTYHNTGLPTDTIYQFGFKKYFSFVNAIGIIEDTIFCATNKGVYRSDINDLLWTATSNGLPKENVRLLKVINDTIFACLEEDLYISTNYGDSWSKSHIFPSSITSIEKLADEFYIGTNENGIFKSNDLTTWTDFNSGLTDLNIKTIKFIDNTLVCGSLKNGMQYFKDDQWISDNSGIICSSIRSLKVINNSLIAVDNNHVYISNNGNNWDDISPVDVMKSSGSLVVMGDTIILSSKNEIHDHFIKYYSIKSNSWHNFVNIPPNGDDPFRMIADGNIIYVYEDDKIFYTNNFGIEWTEISLPGYFCNNVNSIVVFNSELFATACGNGELAKYSNNSWVYSNAGLPTDKPINSLVYSSDAIYAHVHRDGIYVSKNNGDLWTKTKGEWDIERGIWSFAYQGKNIFLSTQDGIFYSFNYGENWNLLNDGLVKEVVTSIVILEDTLYVGTAGNGIWKHAIADVPISNVVSTQNKELYIYPNPSMDYLYILSPFDPLGDVQIFDFMGRKVLSATLQKNGIIDVRGLQRGAYVLTLRSDDKIVTSKLLISR